MITSIRVLLQKPIMASNMVAFKAPERMDTVDRIPNEVLLEIISWLQTSEEPPPLNTNDWPRSGGSTALPTCDWKNEEHPSLQTLRVVNKRLHGLVNPILFGSIILLNHPDWWMKANSIATSSLAPFVKSIQIAVVEDLPDYSTREEWEQWVPYARKKSRYLPAIFPLNVMFRSHEIQWSNIAAGGPVARLDLSSAEKAYSRYRSWVEGENEMRKHNMDSTTPPLRLDLLTNLESLQTLGHYGLRETVKANLGPELYDETKMYSCKYFSDPVDKVI